MEEDLLDDYLSGLGLIHKQDLFSQSGRTYCYSNQSSTARLFYTPGRSAILVYRILNKQYHQEWQLKLNLAHPDSLETIAEFLRETLTSKEAINLGAIDIIELT